LGEYHPEKGLGLGCPQAPGGLFLLLLDKKKSLLLLIGLTRRLDTPRLLLDTKALPLTPVFE
jgi:hypothetical protein